MDKSQFDKFMKAITDVINAAQSSQAHDSINPFENFDATKESFACYIQRFENYLAVKDVTNTTKHAQLLNASIGSVHFNNLASLLGPEVPINNQSYAKLIEHYSRLLSPKQNVIVSQHYFLTTYQAENQSIAEFVATLRRAQTECEFYGACQTCKINVSVAEIFLRAQFIRGLRDEWIREQLLQQSDEKGISFDKIQEKAIALEASRIHSRELGHQARRPEVDANKLSRNQSPGQQPQYRQQRVDYRALGIHNLCFNCASSSHRSNDCHVDRKSLHCNLCSKTGHVPKVCITSLSKKKMDAKQLSEVHDSSDEYQSDYSYGCNKCDVIDLFEVSPCLKKYIVTVAINGKNHDMEVDTGAQFSILPEDIFKRLELGSSLQPSNITFQTFSHNLVPCRGKARVVATYKDRATEADLYVVPMGHDSLLGRDWIRKFDIELRQVDADNQLISPLCHTIKSHHNTSCLEGMHPQTDVFHIGGGGASASASVTAAASASAYATASISASVSASATASISASASVSASAATTATDSTTAAASATTTATASATAAASATTLPVSCQ